MPQKAQKSSSKPTTSRASGAGRAKAAPPKQRAARNQPAPRQPATPSWWSQLSNERKLDLLGVLLSLIGLLTLLSLLSSEQGVLTGWWAGLLTQLTGWGNFLLPALLLVFGMWLVLRNIDRLPSLSLPRLSGLILLYLNIQTWLHLAAGGGWDVVPAGQGGGYIGALLERALVPNLGLAGAVIILLGWLLLALALIFDISVQEIFLFFRELAARAQSTRPPVETMYVPGKPDERMIPPETNLEALPPDFNPLPRFSRAAPQPRATAAAAAAPASPAAATTAPAAAAPVTPAPPPQPIIPWTLPSVEAILDPPTPAAAHTGQDQDRARLIEETLASFGAPAHVVEIHRGPTITQFGVEPDFLETRTGRMRVRVNKIASLADDLALALAAPRIRIQAPVPGRGYVGIEVPNMEVSSVVLRDVMESEPFQKLRSPLRFALGKDVAGKPVAADLAAMPHMLIAGTTGSGKSVCVNAILSCLLLNNTPLDLRLVLVDPKRVELTGYNGVPHLLAPVVVDAERVIGALQWMLREMDARYHRFAQVGARNIQDYNAHQSDHLPYIVTVIDELADLMMLAPDETERSITRLAQLARATGIHLILATQRPSVDVVTGLIKANFPARVAFAVASGVDSRVVLDQPGAERLLGRGDMLFQAPDAPAPVRLQGVYVSDSEIQRLVESWRLQASSLPPSQPTLASTGPVDALPSNVPLKQAPLWPDGASLSKDDPILDEAIELVRREGRASVSMLQRRMRIGYTRAARLIDTMEERGVVGPSLPTSQVREVLDYGQTAPPDED